MTKDSEPQSELEALKFAQTVIAELKPHAAEYGPNEEFYRMYLERNKLPRAKSPRP